MLPVCLAVSMTVSIACCLCTGLHTWLCHWLCFWLGSWLLPVTWTALLTTPITVGLTALPTVPGCYLCPSQQALVRLCFLLHPSLSLCAHDCCQCPRLCSFLRHWLYVWLHSRLCLWLFTVPWNVSDWATDCLTMFMTASLTVGCALDSAPGLCSRLCPCCRLCPGVSWWFRSCVFDSGEDFCLWPGLCSWLHHCVLTLCMTVTSALDCTPDCGFDCTPNCVLGCCLYPWLYIKKHPCVSDCTPDCPWLLTVPWTARSWLHHCVYAHDLPLRWTAFLIAPLTEFLMCSWVVPPKVNQFWALAQQVYIRSTPSVKVVGRLPGTRWL